jgi:ElaB/YqjD/DUF883 family membrane-anchored ribosome-binding protein
MVWDRIKAGWSDLSMAAKAKWDDLTDDELDGLKKIGADLETRFNELRARAGEESSEARARLTEATADARVKLAGMRAKAELKAQDLSGDLSGASEEAKAKAAEIRMRAEEWADRMIARFRKGDTPEA